MRIYRLRHKRNKNRFYTSPRRRRGFFSKLHHLQMAIDSDSDYDPDKWNLVVYEISEVSVQEPPQKLHKITREDAMAIRKKHSQNASISALSREYGIGASTVSRIIHHTTDRYE